MKNDNYAHTNNKPFFKLFNSLNKPSYADNKKDLFKNIEKLSNEIQKNTKHGEVNYIRVKPLCSLFKKEFKRLQKYGMLEMLYPDASKSYKELKNARKNVVISERVSHREILRNIIIELSNMILDVDDNIYIEIKESRSKLEAAYSKIKENKKLC